MASQRELSKNKNTANKSQSTVDLERQCDPLRDKIRLIC